MNGRMPALPEDLPPQRKMDVSIHPNGIKYVLQFLDFRLLLRAIDDVILFRLHSSNKICELGMKGLTDHFDNSGNDETFLLGKAAPHDELRGATASLAQLVPRHHYPSFHTERAARLPLHPPIHPTT